MAKIIVKSSYLKPNARRNVGNYVRYIATREGVEKIDESKKYLPATEKQKQIIFASRKKDVLLRGSPHPLNADRQSRSGF